MAGSVEEVVLLDFKQSMFGMRVRAALTLKGIAYEYKEQDLRNKSQELLDSNPVHKKIPVLIHKGKPVCESLIIVEYIDEVWSDQHPLMPSEPYPRAQARFWADFIDKKVYDAGRRVWSTKGEEQVTAKKDFIEAHKTLEGELGDKPYFGGDTMGFLDVALLPYYLWFYAYESCGNFKVEDECPKIVAWGKRCLEREDLVKALPTPEEIYEFVLRMKKVFGIE